MMERVPEEKIEILSVELLDRHRACVNALKRTARSLNLEFGWHYLLDLTWILDHLGLVRGTGQAPAYYSGILPSRARMC
jgi:hypothetical protein